MPKNKRNDAARCRHCDADMEIVKVKSYSGKWAVWAVGGGVILSLVGGLFFGLLLIVAGIYMALADQVICACPECGYHFKVHLPEKPRSL